MRVVVVNGENDWADYLPGCEVVRHRIQDTRWALRNGELVAFDSERGGRVDAVLWRLGAVRPDSAHVAVLDMIHLAGVPCVNDAAFLARHYDRLSMLTSLRHIGLPTVPFDVISNVDALVRLVRDVPFVVKVGNHHGGLGKTLVKDMEGWRELCDLLAIGTTYATVEPYYDYRRDIRVLLVGEQLWAMQRASAGWRANVETRMHDVIAVPEALVGMTREAAKALGASLLSLDILELHDGSFVVLESNETPGFTGFPKSVRHEVAGMLLQGRQGRQGRQG